MKNAKFKNLAAEMTRLGINQVELGKMLGLSKTAINNRLHGVVDWKMDEIWQTLEIFKKDFEYLFK